jgi:ABC-type sugar transport system permease subunit
MVVCATRVLAHPHQIGPTAREEFLLVPFLLGCAIVMLAVPMGFLVSDWFKNRRDLLESETYLILFAVALYVSAWFGLANFTLYFSDKNSFVVDKQLEQGFTESQEKEWQQRLIDSGSIARSCEEMVRLLQQEPGEKLELSKVSHDSYRTVLRGSNAVINYILFPGWDKLPPPGIPPVYLKSISVKIGNQTVSFEARRAELLFPEPIGEFMEHPEGGIAKSFLIATFREKARWEYEFWLNPMNAGIPRRPIPLSLFIYQAVMDTVGAGPKYFIPANFSARLLAFLYAVCKFIFFGMLVAALMKQFKTSKIEESKVTHA